MGGLSSALRGMIQVVMSVILSGQLGARITPVIFDVSL